MRAFPLLTFVPICFALMTACSADKVAQAPVSAESGDTPMSASPLFGGVDLTAPLSLVGTEPFWGVKIADGAAIVSRMDQVEASYSVTDFAVNGATATLQNGALLVTLTAVPCSDGMSDRVYPLTAEVKMGEETLKGCAMPTAEMMADPV